MELYELYALDDLGPLRVQLVGVTLVGLLLALHRFGTLLAPHSRRPDNSSRGMHSARPTSHHRGKAAAVVVVDDEKEKRSSSSGAVLTSSKPVHLWSSSNRCFAQ